MEFIMGAMFIGFLWYVFHADRAEKQRFEELYKQMSEEWYRTPAGGSESNRDSAGGTDPVERNPNGNGSNGGTD